MKPTVFLCSLLVGASPAHAQSDWPDWRGPNGDGSLEKGSLTMEFSINQGVAWKTPLTGRGCSTPVVSKGLIFITAPVEGKDTLFAYDLEGKEKWRQSYGKETPGRGQRVG
ncbi:MAG: PQQ-binding-like beta-propeller repeat protein, partial [Akkermansiaceae bacterium]